MFQCKQRIAAGQQGAAAAIYASNPSTSAPNEPVRKAAKHKQVRTVASHGKLIFTAAVVLAHSIADR